MVYYLTRKRLERYNKGEKLDDFFTYLFEDKYGNPNMYPMGELAAEASIMMNAGSDTTAIALTNVLYWLLKNPDAFAKLREELDAVLDPDEPVAPFDRVKHLPYLRACLDESMRLTPPNTMNIPRITPPQGLSVMGYWIPGRTTVHCSTYTIHRNPKIFVEPLAYKPERWLGEDGKDLQQHFLTFSAGARGCIGRNITYMEQTIVLASLIFRFDFSLMSDDWVLEQEESFTCSPSDFPIRVRRRDFENLKA
jgi:cytochrome P450